MDKRAGLLVYGANGYTGRLIAAVAIREGLRPVLAGRRAGAVEPLAKALALKSLCFPLTDPELVSRLLAPFEALLLAAGPFSKTSAVALEACLRAKTAYLDITGEIDVFEACFARNGDAVKAGIPVLPGTGFDVVPSDCLAAALAGGAAGGDAPSARLPRLQGERGDDEDDDRGPSEGGRRARGREDRPRPAGLEDDDDSLSRTSRGSP